MRACVAGSFFFQYKTCEPELRNMAKMQPEMPRRPPPSPPRTSPEPCAAACESGCGFSLTVPMLEGQAWRCEHSCHRGAELDLLDVNFPAKGIPTPFASAETKAKKLETRRAQLEHFLMAAVACCNARWRDTSTSTSTTGGADAGGDPTPWQVLSKGLSANSRSLVLEFIGVPDAEI